MAATAALAGGGGAVRWAGLARRAGVMPKTLEEAITSVLDRHGIDEDVVPNDTVKEIADAVRECLAERIKEL